MKSEPIPLAIIEPGPDDLPNPNMALKAAAAEAKAAEANAAPAADAVAKSAAEPATPSAAEAKPDESTKHPAADQSIPAAPGADQRDPFAFAATPASPASPFSELDPELPAASPFIEPAGVDPLDPFAELPSVNEPPAPAPIPHDSGSTAEFARHSAFSFADMLDDAKQTPAASSPAPAPRPMSVEDREETRPGVPSEELLAHSRGEESTQFPGDEPTRIEAVSAALLDKLREKDEPEEQHPHAEPSHAEPEHAHAESTSTRIPSPSTRTPNLSTRTLTRHPGRGS